MDEWTEKYRPKTLDDLVIKNDFKNLFNDYFTKKTIPSLLLCGSPGIGKSTLAKIIVRELDSSYLYINASDENGIETIRVKVKEFADSVSFDENLKVIILDESDNMCLDEQTKVWCYKNSSVFLKKLKKFKGNEEVLSYNFKTNKIENNLSKVIFKEKSVKTLRIKTAKLDDINCTPNHKFFVKTDNTVNVKKASDINIKIDKLLKLDKLSEKYTEIEITSIEKNKEFKNIIDIEVENNHNFILENNIISHNSSAAQASLRNVIEESSDDTRFIFTCNFPSKMTDAIKSRCSPFTLTSTPKDILNRLFKILDSENISYSKEDKKIIAVDILKKFYPDIRSMIKHLEFCCISGTFKFVNFIDKEGINEVSLFLKDNISSKDIIKCRKFWILNETKFNKDYEFLTKYLFELYSDNFKAMEILAEYSFKMSQVLDKEIQFTGMILNLMKAL